MKFGRNLPRNQVPEWASSYLNYKALKKLIKASAEGLKQDGSLDLAGTTGWVRAIGKAYCD
jgi:glycerophosphodiester phosphodiesterase